jgi:hypothetical protein
MEEAGAKPLDVYASEVSAGDLLFVPTQNTNVEMPRKGDVEWVGKLETTPCRWLGVLNAFAGAGYYSDHWGPLPFVFGRVLPEEVWVFSFNRNRIGLVDSAEARHEADSTP